MREGMRPGRPGKGLGYKTALRANRLRQAYPRAPALSPARRRVYAARAFSPGRLVAGSWGPASVGWLARGYGLMGSGLMGSGALENRPLSPRLSPPHRSAPPRPPSPPPP